MIHVSVQVPLRCTLKGRLSVPEASSRNWKTVERNTKKCARLGTPGCGCMITAVAWSRVAVQRVQCYLELCKVLIQHLHSHCLFTWFFCKLLSKGVVKTCVPFQLVLVQTLRWYVAILL